MTRSAKAWDGVDGYGRRPASAEPQVEGPQLGRVTKSAPGAVTFVLPDYDGGTFAFGPAPHARPTFASVDDDGAGTDAPHTHTVLPPPVGATCLVIFVGGGIERPVVVAWW